MPFSLWEHQEQGLAFIEPREASMCAGGMGTGKTAIAAHAQSRWGCRRSLVICPPSVRGVWRRALPMHSPTDVRACILDKGTVAMRAEAADEALRDPSAVVVVVNTEAVWREPLASWVLDRRWDCVTIDESHLGGVKNDASHASRFVAQLTDQSIHRLCLTGTPLAHSPTDAWGQYRFLDRGIFGDDYRAYLQRYLAKPQIYRRKRLHQTHDAVADAIAQCFGANSELLTEWGECPDYSAWLPGIRNADEFTARISPYTWYAPTIDVLKLPPLIQDSRSIELGPHAQRIYDDLIYRLHADVGAGCTINSAFTLGVRLQQITSGFLPDDRGRLHEVDAGKREVLRELLQTAGERTVVFARFVRDLDAIAAVCKTLRLRYGELSHRRKDALTDLATLADPVDVAGVQYQSGGAGIDLSSAKLGIWYSRPRSLPDHDQAVARLHRPGTTGTRIISLIAAGTIDEEIQADIDDRRDIVHGLLARLKNRVLTRSLPLGIIPETSDPPSFFFGDN